MATSRDAWQDVGERFTAVGRQVREATSSGATSAGGDLKSALRDLASAVDAAFSGLEDAFTDAELRREVRSALASLRDAVSSSFEDLGSTLRRDPPHRGGGVPVDEPEGGPTGPGGPEPV